MAFAVLFARDLIQKFLVKIRNLQYSLEIFWVSVTEIELAFSKEFYKYTQERFRNFGHFFHVSRFLRGVYCLNEFPNISLNWFLFYIVLSICYNQYNYWLYLSSCTHITIKLFNIKIWANNVYKGYAALTFLTYILMSYTPDRRNILFSPQLWSY